ncbi:unnamed protein product [Thlaspi arvense]|uniref:Probable magnesium transporter n=1 Tax=Thlaspi arvense TaxID=13288 RepID=A0AAU9SV14_THLAR|nr:unnamed protein product [Thlaspi arvense]
MESEPFRSRRRLRENHVGVDLPDACGHRRYNNGDSMLLVFDHVNHGDESEPVVIRAYAVNKPWALGFLMDIFGALLMLRALSLAPVSVVQPVSGCGLAILSVFSHFYLKEVMNVFDWIGITVAGIGTIGVGAGGEEQEASLISVFQLLWLALVLLNAWLHIFKRQRREQELGFSAMFIPMCISISICCSGTGFFYQTRGLKHGRAIVVSTCAAVASIGTDHARCCVTRDFITTNQTSATVVQAFQTDECRKRVQHKADIFSRTKGYKPKCGYPSSNITPSLINPVKRERLMLQKHQSIILHFTPSFSTKLLS